MKILHTADWHLGKSLYDFSLIPDQSHFIDQFIQLIQREKADAVVIAGDIYDRAVPPLEAVSLYNRFLTAVAGGLHVPVLAIAGNHDSAGRLDFGRELCRDSGYYISGQVRGEIEKVTLHDSLGPVHFYLLPYLSPADMRALAPEHPVRTYNEAYSLLLEINQDRIDPAERNVLIAHGFFAGLGGNAPLLTCDSEVTVGGMDIVDSGLLRWFDYVALGHLHMCQRAGGDCINYSGSPIKYSLSEQSHQKAVLSVNLGEKGEISVEKLDIRPRREVRSIEGYFEELIDPSRHANQNFEDYVYAVLLDKLAVAYPMEKLRTLFPNLLGLRFGGEPSGESFVPAGEAVAKRDPGELFAEFYQAVNGEEMSTEECDYLALILAGLEEQAQEESQGGVVCVQ